MNWIDVMFVGWTVFCGFLFVLAGAKANSKEAAAMGVLWIL